MFWIVLLIVAAIVIYFVYKRNKTQAPEFIGNERDESLTGTWGDGDTTLELLNDGTGTWEGPWGDSSIEKWSSSDNKISVLWGGSIYTYEYTVSGSTLTLLDIVGNDSGNKYIYTKK